MHQHISLFPKANAVLQSPLRPPYLLQTICGAALILYDYYTLYTDIIYLCRRTKLWSQIAYFIHCIAVALNFHGNRKIISYNLSNDFLFFFEDFENMFTTIVWRKYNYFRDKKNKTNWSVRKEVYKFQKNTKFTAVIQ